MLIKIIRGVQVVIIVILAFVAYGITLPDEARVEREIVIDAGPQAIFDRAGEESFYRRHLPQPIGEELKIVNRVPYKFVIAEHRTRRNERGLSTVTIYNDRENSRCRVTWAYKASLRGTRGRYAGLLLERRLAPSLETGLRLLKQAIEDADVQSAPD